MSSYKKSTIVSGSSNALSQNKPQYYTYRQNNSGGTFTGPAIIVFIQAYSEEEANRKAMAEGLYFDGDGDCPCCGNRWSDWNDKGFDEPMIYGETIEEHLNGKDLWTDLYKNEKVPYIRVYHLTGDIDEYTLS